VEGGRVVNETAIMEVLDVPSDDWTMDQREQATRYFCSVLPEEPSAFAVDLFGAGAHDDWRRFRQQPPLTGWFWKPTWAEQARSVAWLIEYAMGQWLRTWRRAPRPCDSQRRSEEILRFERAMLREIDIKTPCPDGSDLVKALHEWAVVEIEMALFRPSTRGEKLHDFVKKGRVDRMLDDHNPYLLPLIARVQAELNLEDKPKRDRARRNVVARLVNTPPSRGDDALWADRRKLEHIERLATLLFGLTLFQIGADKAEDLDGESKGCIVDAKPRSKESMYQARHRAKLARDLAGAFVAAVDTLPHDLCVPINRWLTVLMDGQASPAPLDPAFRQRIRKPLISAFEAEVRNRRIAMNRARRRSGPPPAARSVTRQAPEREPEKLTAELKTKMKTGLNRFFSAITAEPKKRNP
jgi:hypothetical protein